MKNVYVYRVITLGNDCIFSFLWWVVFSNKLWDLRTWTPHIKWRSAFFELSHPRTHIFHVHNAITACLTQLSMNFDWFHATQVEESDNHALFFECKCRHFSIKNTTATRPRHKHSTGSTVLPLGLAQPKEQPRLLQQLSRFYLLPFPRKELGYLTTWTPQVEEDGIMSHQSVGSLSPDDTVLHPRKPACSATQLWQSEASWTCAFS